MFSPVGHWVCPAGVSGKKRLRQRTYRRSHELAGIHNHRTGRIGPARISAQRDGRIEGRTRRIGSVERRFQCPLGRADIGTAGKHLNRNPYRKVRGELLPASTRARNDGASLPATEQGCSPPGLSVLPNRARKPAPDSRQPPSAKLPTHSPCPHSSAHGFKRTVPFQVSSVPGDGKLLVQHQQGIVGIGYPGNELGARRWR